MGSALEENPVKNLKLSVVPPNRNVNFLPIVYDFDRSVNVSV